MKTYTSLVILHSFCHVFAAPTNNFTTAVASENVSCDNPVVSDPNADPSKRWIAANAEAAYDMAAGMWALNGVASDGTSLSFSQYISDYFDSKDLMMCANMGDGPCQDTVLCDDVNQPAGFLILNSFVAIHVFHRNVYDALENAMNQIQSFIPKFQATFAPISPPEESKRWLRNLLNVFQTVVTVATGYAFAIPLKSTSLFLTNPNLYEFAQGSVFGVIGGAWALGKEYLPTTKVDVQDDFSMAMGEIFKALIDVEVAQVKKIFSGKMEDLPLMKGLVDNGFALALTKDLDLGEFTDIAQKIVYAKLLPMMWRDSPIKAANDWIDVTPMILIIQDGCVRSGDDLSEYIYPNDSEKISICHDGHTFFIGYPQYDSVKIENGEWTEEEPPKFKNLRVIPLPGGTHDELDGTKWNGLQLDDIIISSYEGWKLGGGKNNYTIEEDSAIKDGSASEAQVILDNGVRTPGYSSIPICTGNMMKLGAAAHEIQRLFPWSRVPVEMPWPCGDLVDWEKKAWGFE